MEKQQPRAEKEQEPWLAKRVGRFFSSPLTTARPMTSSQWSAEGPGGHVEEALEPGWVAVNKTGRGPVSELSDSEVGFPLKCKTPQSTGHELKH